MKRKILKKYSVEGKIKKERYRRLMKIKIVLDLTIEDWVEKYQVKATECAKSQLKQILFKKLK